MEVDFSKFFEKYEKLVAEVDKAFEQVQAQHGDCIKCQEGCSDCCHALFDLSLIEALYLNHKFNVSFDGQQRSDLLARADKAERQGYKIKRQAFTLTREGASTAEVLESISKARVRCPLLGTEEKCDMYDFRPITCRLYGIPTSIGGKAHTCGKAGFKEGVAYPTVHIEKIQDRLAILSDEFVRSLRTKFTRLAEAYVPVSMAMMNKYDDEYLGILSDEEWEKIEKVKAAMAGAAQAEVPMPGNKPGAAAAQTFGGDTANQPSACASCSEQQGSDACSTCGTLNWELGGGKEK